MKNTTKLRLKIAGTLSITAILFVGLISLLTFFLLKGCEEVTDRGLKNIVEQIWEGKQSQGETQ